MNVAVSPLSIRTATCTRVAERRQQQLAFGGREPQQRGGFVEVAGGGQLSCGGSSRAN